MAPPTHVVRTVSLLLILAGLVAGAAALPGLPSEVVVHWDLDGTPDGTLPAWAGIVLLPLAALGLLTLLLAVPRIDPLQENIARFRGWYDGFVLLTTTVLMYAQGLLLAWNLGARITLARWLAPAVAGFLVYLGIVSRHSERNWFIGFRTPWSLSDDETWRRTNDLGGRLLVLSAALTLAAVVLPSLLVHLLAGSLATTAIVTTFYSLWVHKRRGSDA